MWWWWWWVPRCFQFHLIGKNKSFKQRGSFIVLFTAFVLTSAITTWRIRMWSHRRNRSTSRRWPLRSMVTRRLVSRDGRRRWMFRSSLPTSCRPIGAPTTRWNRPRKTVKTGEARRRVTIPFIRQAGVTWRCGSIFAGKPTTVFFHVTVMSLDSIDESSMVSCNDLKCCCHVKVALIESCKLGLLSRRIAADTPTWEE